MSWRCKMTGGKGWLPVLTVVLLASSALADLDPARFRVRWGDVPEHPVWVGQQVLTPMTLLMRDRQRGTPVFRLPDVTGGVFIQLPGSPQFDSEEIDGVSFASWTYLFAFYSHQPGEHPLPSMRVQVSLSEGDGTFTRFEASTSPIAFRSRLPQGVVNSAGLITAPELEAREDWTPDKADVMIGDAVSRSVTLRASEVLGMGFPPLSFVAPEGVSLYPKPPLVSDEVYRGAVKGQRIEAMVYMFEREGTVVLPGARLAWFDPKTETLKDITLPSREFVVKANPAFAAALPASPENGSPIRRIPAWVFIVCGVVPFGVWGGKKYVSRPRLKTLPPLNPES